MRVILKDELHSIQPVIKVTVENAIRKLIPESICSADDVKEVVKSYAEVTKEQQRRVIEEAALAKSSKDVVESVVRQLDSDKIEREKGNSMWLSLMFRSLKKLQAQVKRIS